MGMGPWLTPSPYQRRIIMAKKKVIPEYSKIKKNGSEYYRTRILDADGKQVDIYGKTCEEVYDKAQAASKAIAEAVFRKNN